MAMPANCMDVGTKLGERMAALQSSLNAFVLGHLGHDAHSWNKNASSPANVLFIKRQVTRRWAKGDLPKLKETARRVVNGRGWVRDIAFQVQQARRQNQNLVDILNPL